MIDRLWLCLVLLAFPAQGMEKSQKIAVFSDYEEKKDTVFLENLFKNDCQWLISKDYVDGVGVKTFINCVADAKINKRKIMRINDEPVAFLIYFVLYKNTLNKNFHDGDKVLALMGVDPDKRNRKYGSEVMQYFKKESRKFGSKKVWLSVHKDNILAQKLYKKFGFKNTNVTSWGASQWWSAYILKGELNERALYDHLLDQKFCDIAIKHDW